MICKEDVVLWFKELESYKRIDTMCTLLNMCLPFELRFLGTCLEELCRRDSQELRGMELHVNNPVELARDVAACRQGEPTDRKIRRKMAFYLALIRACSRSSVNELFQTLDGWGDRDFMKFGDGDPLQELLLVYTMASNHPVFSFEQRMKCGEIYTKINDCNKVLSAADAAQQQPATSSPPPSSSSSQSTTSLSSYQQKPFKMQHNVSVQSSPPPQQPISVPPPSHQQQVMSVQQIPAGMMLPQGQIPIGFSQNTMSQVSTGRLRYPIRARLVLCGYIINHPPCANEICLPKVYRTGGWRIMCGSVQW